jgi:hypothetical protein
VAFKAIDSALSGQNGRFDSDTLPPIRAEMSPDSGLRAVIPDTFIPQK